MPHEMIRTDAEKGIWECPSCSRKIVLKEDKHEVLVPGERVGHFGSTYPGVRMGFTQIIQES